MDSTDKQKAKGMMGEAKGKIKQAAGDLTDDKKMHAEGQVDEAKGKGNQAVADAKKAVKDIID